MAAWMEESNRRLDQKPHSSHHCVLTVREVVAVLLGRQRAARRALPSLAWLARHRHRHRRTGTAYRVPAHASRPPGEPRRRAFHCGARRRRAELPYAADGISCQLRVKARRGWTAHG